MCKDCFWECTFDVRQKKSLNVLGKKAELFDKLPSACHFSGRKTFPVRLLKMKGAPQDEKRAASTFVCLQWRVSTPLHLPVPSYIGLTRLSRNALLQEPRVLKEQVTALYDMASWDLFVASRNAREKQWREEKQSERESRRAEEKMAKEDRLMAQQTVVQRLANFAGPVGRCSKNYRVADSGRPLGLLLGTPTFMEAQNLDAALKESKETKELH